MSRYHPRAVIVECGGFAAGARFRSYVSEVSERCKTPFNVANECDFTILKALQENIPMANGEPTDEVIFEEILARGYSSKEYEFFMFLRRIGSLKRHHRIDPSSFDNLSQVTLDSFASRLSIPVDKRLSLKECKVWFNHYYPERRSLLNISSNDTGPDSSGGATFAQRLSYDIDQTREPHIVRTITDMLNLHKSVLVVYGAAHRESHLPVFEEMLGRGEIHILVPTAPRFKITITGSNSNP